MDTADIITALAAVVLVIVGLTVVALQMWAKR